MNVNNEWNNFMIFFSFRLLFFQLPLFLLFYYTLYYSYNDIKKFCVDHSSNNNLGDTQKNEIKYEKFALYVKLSYLLHTLHILCFIWYQWNRMRDFHLYVLQLDY